MAAVPAAGPQRDLAPHHPPKQQLSLGTRIVYWFQDETTSEIQKIACFALLAIATFSLAQFTGKPILFVATLALLTTAWVKFEEHKMALAEEDDLETEPDTQPQNRSFDTDSIGAPQSTATDPDELTVLDTRDLTSSACELDEKEPDDRNEPFLDRLIKAVGGPAKYCEIWEIPATEEDLKKYLVGSNELPLATNPQRGVIMKRNRHYFLIRFIDKENKKKGILLIERSENEWEFTEYDERENTLQKKDITHFLLHMIEVSLNGRHPTYKLK